MGVFEILTGRDSGVEGDVAIWKRAVGPTPLRDDWQSAKTIKATGRASLRTVHAPCLLRKNGCNRCCRPRRVPLRRFYQWRGVRLVTEFTEAPSWVVLYSRRVLCSSQVAGYFSVVRPYPNV